MALNKKQHYRGNAFGNKDLTDAKSLQLTEDANSADKAVRKSQAENISDAAAQDILVALTQDASNTTAFTSSSMVGFLNGKQDNLEIDASSAAYLQIVDGYKLKATQLLITDVEVNETHTTLTSYLAAHSTPDKQEGDVIILTSASDNQERSWIKTGSASQGVDGYTRLQTDYNVTTIRTMFSSAQYLSYDSASGQFGLILGNTAGELGAHTLPIDGNLFSVITGSTIGEITKKLEDLIVSVQSSSNDGTAVVNTRLSTLSGVTGNSMEFFTTLFSNNSTIKGLFLESEALHQAAIVDRAFIRNQFADADTGLQQNIDAEVANRIAAISQEASARQASDSTINGRIDAAEDALDNEEVRAIAAENALDARLDVVEGSGVGSINKAQSDAQLYAAQIVANEANSRSQGDANLQIQIDAISSAFLYKGYVGADGRVQHIDTLHANHNLPFENITLFNGDFYKVNATLTITFSDNSTIEVEAGDGLLGIEDIASGSVTSAHIHKTDNTEAADILREGQLDATHLERVANSIRIKADSLGREKLSADVETDIDNKVLKSGDIMTGALKIDKVVNAGTGYTDGYDYAAYIKMKSVGTSSLTDTQRGVLVENEIYTDGSGNPLELDYANAATLSSHYKGASNDMTVAIVGSNGEGRVFNPMAAVYATGAYGSSTDSQLGVNAGGTFVGQNAATANLGMFAFSDTAGALNNRGAYIALSSAAVDFDAYRVARVANPLPVQDAALLVDDYTGNKHAIYANGKVEINGKVIIPSAAEDNEAVNLGDVKAKEFATTKNISAGGFVTINHNLNSENIIPALWLNGELVTSAFDVEASSANSLTIHNDLAQAVTDLKVLVFKLSV
tara:strand:+ start:1378 stop:3936 length:2559 start_codon:yes stop_codon:yes gene_type:complete